MKLALVVLALIGCGGKESGGGGGSAGGGSSGPAPSPSEVPAEMVAWMPKDAQQAWQGAWLTRMTLDSALNWGGSIVALDIKGDGAKAFDGKKEYPLGLVIAAPCAAEFKQAITEGSFKGGTSTHTKQFVIKDGKVLAAEGAAGYRKGKTAVVCTISIGVATLDDKGDCKVWSKTFDEWKSKPTKCTWKQEEGKDVLEVGEGSWTYKLIADGDVLMDDQLARQIKDGKHKRADSYDAAKAEVTKTIKENDPGEQAKAAGGKVGDTGSVLGLIATFAADKKSIEGKTIELTGQYFSTSSLSSNGKTTYGLELIDSKDTTKLVVSCQTAETDSKAFAIKQYDKVTVKGTVKESFNKVSLQDCSLKK